MRIRRHHPPTHPDLPARQLLVPVLAATGGSGRSTVAALLAQAVAPHVRTVVLDSGHPAGSPWPPWLTRPAPAPVPTGAEPGPQELFAACAAMRAPEGATVQVLTPAGTSGQSGRDANPIGVGACARYADMLGHPIVVVDTDTNLLHTPLHHIGRGGGVGAAAWLGHPEAAPVLCVPASPKGVADAAVVVTALEHTAGVSPDRVTVVVVGIAGSQLPRRVLAGLTLLQERVHAIVRIGHDPRIRGTGRPVLDRATRAVRRAVADLADTVTTTTTPTPSRAGAESRCDVATRHTSPRKTPSLEKGHP